MVGGVGGVGYPWKIGNAWICTHPLPENRFKHHTEISKADRGQKAVHPREDITVLSVCFT